MRFALDRRLIRGRVIALDGSRFSAASSARKRQQRDEVEAEIAAHEAEIGRYLEDLAEADDATDREELEAEKARIRAAVAELQGEVARKREALDATLPGRQMRLATPCEPARTGWGSVLPLVRAR